MLPRYLINRQTDEPTNNSENITSFYGNKVNIGLDINSLSSHGLCAGTANGLLCANVPLRNYSLTHSQPMAIEASSLPSLRFKRTIRPIAR